MLDAYPLGVALGVVAMLLVAIFFVSGADAASIVMGTLAQRGSIEPTRGVVIFWGVLMGTIGAIMLLVGGGGDAALSGILKLTIITAAPFALIMVLMCIALAKELRNDPMVHHDDRTREKIARAVEYGTTRYGDHFHLRVDPKNRDSRGGGRLLGGVGPAVRGQPEAGQVRE